MAALLYLAVSLLSTLSLKTQAARPTVSPIGGSHQIAVLPSSHTLSFTVSPSVPPANISWSYHNGLVASSLDDSSDPSLSFTSDRLNLTISLPGLASKEGTYTLTAVNGDGTDSGEIVLDIKSRPAFLTLPSSQNKHEGENVTFSCFATGDPTPSIDWIFNDTRVINSSNGKYLIGEFGEPDFGSLTVRDLEFPDTGVYICRAYNDYGSLNSSSVELGVQVLPSITSQPSDISPVAGGVAQLRCSVRGFPPVRIYWTKNMIHNVTDLQSVVHYSNSLVYDHTGLVTHSTLTLDGSVLSTNGNYTCTATNFLKTFESATSMEAQVFVQYPPATAVSDDIVKVNSTFSTTFNCSSFGIPAPNLYWYFNGGSIESGGVVTVTRSSFINESDLYIRSIELSISEADRASHEGNYTCVAINNVTNLISSLENMTVRLYVQVPPRLVSPDGASVLGVVGSSITIRFRVEDASPDVRPESISWSFQNNPLNQSDRFVYSENRRSLTINNLSHDDEGSYNILVINEAGTDSLGVYLEIEAVPVFVPPLLSNVNVLQFNDAQLRCTVTAEPQPTIQWFFGSQPVNLSRYSVGFYNGSQMREYYSVLSINSSLMSDTGDYTCVLANVHGPVNATAHVEVQIPPTITRDPANVIVIRNNSFSLDCSAFGSPTPNITWLKGGMALSSSNLINIVSSSTGFTGASLLTVYHSSFSDSEDYVCLAENSLVALISKNSSTATITVNQPPLLYDVNKLGIVNQSQNINMTCRFLSLPPSNITWSRSDSIDLSNSSKFMTFIDYEMRPEGGMISSSTLQVLDVGEGDTGNYSCTARNRAGGPSEPLNITTESFHVQVQTSPIVTRVSSPVEIGVSTKDITLSFRISRDIPPVSEADIKWYLNGSEVLPDERHEFTDSRRSLSIINLTLPYDEGEYSMIASNIIGEGTDSLFLDVEVAPIITSNSGIVHAVEGRNATFNCHGISEPVHFTSWLFNGTVLSPDFTKYTILGNNTSNSTLIVSDVRLSDQGVYQCNTSNVHGVDYAVAQLFIQVPPVITTPPVSSTVLVNTSAQFQCCSSGVPLPVVHWVKNGTLVDADERINFAITEAVNHNCSQLIISNPVFPDRGEYTCHASNVLAEELMATSNSVELVVQYPPEVYPISDSVYIRNESDSFTIKCISFGVPLPTIYWLPGPLNVTRDIGNGDQFLTRGEVSPFMTAINGQAIRLLNLSDQCPMDDGPLVCRDAVDYGNNTGTGCNGLSGSLCPVSCGVVINSYNDTDDMDRPVTVSSLTLCSLLKTEELSYTCLAVNNVTNDLGTPQGVSTNLIVQVKPVVSSGQVSPHIAFRGHNTTLHFNISLASPDVTPGDITWSFTHRFLDISTDNITGSEHYQYSSSRRSLTLVNLTTNDTGVYQFTAVNPAGCHTDTVELSVQALPEIILSTPDPLVTSTGANVSLDCFADGSPLQNVTWIFTNISGVRLFEIQFVVDNDTARTGYTKYTPLVSDINEAYISERFSISDNTIPSERVYGRLNINNINVYDAGNYTCTLTNIYNLMDPDTYTVEVKVQLSPSVSAPPQSTTCTAGSSCSFNCTITGVPAPNITWYHENELIDQHLIQTHYTYTQTVSILNIANTGLSNSGRYHCVGSNVLESSETVTSISGNLTLMYPSEILVGPSDAIVNETFSATLTCTATGYPLPTITWWRGSQRIQNDNVKYNITETVWNGMLLYNITSVLVINDINKGDQRTYNCSSTNGVGNFIGVTGYAVSQLTIQVPPTIIGVSSSKVSKGSNLVISFNITRASPLVELGDIVWSFISINDPERTLIVLNVSCSEMGGATCDDAHRYERYNFTFYHNETSLVIENAQVEDYGDFILTVSNPAGVTNYTHALRVNVPAQIGGKGSTIYRKILNETINIMLNCTADGIPRPGILWFYNNVLLDETKPRVKITLMSIDTGPRNDVVHPDGTGIISVVTITDANARDDGGTYICEAENTDIDGGTVGRAELKQPYRLIIDVDTKNYCVSSPCLNGGTCRNQRDSFLCLCVETGETVYGGKTCEIETTIQIPPAFTEKPSMNIFASLFDPVTLYCSATGQPVPRITWYKDGAVIPDAPIRTGTNDYLIKEITLADRGNYHCVAKNSAGEVPSTPILVNIEDVVEYIANLTVNEDNLRSGANLTAAADSIVNSINSGIAGNRVGSNSTFFFIERQGPPINRTTNITIPIKITIRLERDVANDELRRTVENVVSNFGHQITDAEGVGRFNYCPPDDTYIDSPDGDIELRIKIVWPEILRGKTQTVICPCDFQLSTSDLIATRECGGNVGTVAQWGRRYDSPCNFTVTTRRLCKLANLTISELLSGLDDITTNAGNIDSAGVSVTAVALDTVEEDVIRNDTLIGSSMNVYNNIQGVNRNELVNAQRSSGSSSKMLRSLFNITNSLPPNTTILRDRMAIMTGDILPSVLSSTLNTNSSQGNYSSSSSVSVTLPDELSNGATNNNFSLTLFSNDALFVSDKSSRKVASSVLDLSLSNEVAGLSDPVQISFDTFVPPEGDYVMTCAFWDTAANDWSSDGCRLEGQTCMCDHLTSFAILLDVAAEEPPTAPEAEVFQFLTYIGLTVSIICLIVTLITYLGTPKLRKSEASQLLIHLSFALLGLYLTFIIALQGDRITRPLCGLIGVLVHYFFLAVFFIMAAESVDLFIKLVIVLGPKIQRFILKAAIIAWIAPLFIVVFCFVPDVNHYIQPHYCGPTQTPLYIGILIPFSVIYIFNYTIFFIIMISLLKKSAKNKFNEAKKKNRKAEVKKQCRVAFTVSVLFGLGWGFGVLASQAIGVTAIRIMFNSVFTIFTVFQGFFIFLLYVVLSPNARAIWKRWILRKEEKSSEATSSVGPSTSRTTQKTNVGSRATNYGKKVGGVSRNTLYRNVYSAAKQKNSSPYVTRDFISSDLGSSQQVVEELKQTLKFRSLEDDDEYDERTFMNPLDELGDVMSLMSDTQSIHETTFSFPNPNPPDEEEEEEERDDLGAMEEGTEKCSTFKNPLRQSVHKTMSRPPDETELLSQQSSNVTDPPGLSVTLNLSDINGFSFSPSSPSYTQSQSLSATDASLLIKDEQVSEL